MVNKYAYIVDLAALTARRLSSGGEPYMAFLQTAAHNFKYNFREQLLIHAQRPGATACAEIAFWNSYGRLVKQGSKGIALLVDSDTKYKLRYVFDVADTHSPRGRSLSLWQMRAEYTEPVIADLTDSFGAAADNDLAEALRQTAVNLTQDKAAAYYADLLNVGETKIPPKEDFANLLQNSVWFMLLTRCGIAYEQYLSAADFQHITEFKQPERIAVLGEAVSQTAEEVLREIAQSVQQYEKKRIRTFAENEQCSYYENNQSNIERSADDEQHYLPSRGELSAAEFEPAAKREIGQIWNAAADISAGTEAGDLHRPAAFWSVEQTSFRDRPASNGNGGAVDQADGRKRRRDGGIERRQSTAMGGADEQSAQRRRGNRVKRVDLQLRGYDYNARSDEQLSLFEQAGQKASPAFALSQAEKENNAKQPAVELSPIERYDFQITDDNLGAGTPGERFARNVAAIRLLKQLESENRHATPDEQIALSQYVGWGGLADCFDEQSRHYAELKALLSPEEYEAARESTLTAFYTPPVVIRAMYQALANLGFKGGNILEPACGSGNFIGMRPEGLAASLIYGVELDSISGRIAGELYQNAKIAVQGFENTDFPDSFFDVAIGNIPFGAFKIQDRRYDKYNFLIHDYFLARALDKVRPGGVIAFVTSKGTMDKANANVRKYLAERAELLGAVRLPNNTFKAAAGTEVTSDIIFLQKREALSCEEPDWVHLNIAENGLKINQYFIDHPEMILGEMREVSGPYGAETACLPKAGQDLAEALSAAIQNIRGNIREYTLEENEPGEEDLSIPATPEVKNFSYTLVDGKIYYRENSRMQPVNLSDNTAKRVKGLIAIRDSVRRLIDYQTEDWPDSNIQAEQQQLNRLYDDFCRKFGRINSRGNASAFNADSAYFLLCSLEILDDNGKFLRKADMFSKRTIKQKAVITSVNTANEALAVSLSEKACVDLGYMASLMGGSDKIPQLVKDLQVVIFKDPLSGAFDWEENGTHWAQGWQTAEEYLSGNVREKLRIAQRIAEDNPRDFAENVQALELVQPVDLSAGEIEVSLGSTWLPPQVAEQFVYELLETPRFLRDNIHVRYSPYSAEWNIEGKSVDKSNIKAISTYGTERANAYKIIEDTLNLRSVRVYDYVEDSNKRRVAVLNKKETAIAQGKQEQIKQAFKDWIWRDDQRREQLCRLYNDRFNNLRPREYDGSHLKFVGINPEITLRPHQINAIARIIYGGNTLLAHVVGAGKTFEMVAAAQESKRLGLCRKSLFVVPNHLTEQWATEYLQLYPAANILVATRKDFASQNRKRFCGRIATGDYDAVIIGHSQFEKIPMSLERQQKMLEQQLEEVMEGIAELKANKGDHFSVKQLERAKKGIKAKMQKLNDQSRKDDVVTFEELGVDRIFVDEAHYYKNLAIFSKMRNVGGISQTEAMKSSDLYMKCRYLDEVTGGRGVIFATGTPISNTMVEMFTMQKYLQYKTLAEKGLLHFDAWASTFGETVTAIELAPEGYNF